MSKEFIFQLALGAIQEWRSIYTDPTRSIGSHVRRVSQIKTAISALLLPFMNGTQQSITRE